MLTIGQFCLCQYSLGSLSPAGSCHLTVVIASHAAQDDPSVRLRILMGQGLRVVYDDAGAGAGLKASLKGVECL